jgi:hypothetical protein
MRAKPATLGRRRTVSYFEQQFRPRALMDPRAYLKDVAKEGHFEDIAEKGYNEVVLCLSELDGTRARRDMTRGLVEAARKSGLAVASNAWRYAGRTGGEAYSTFEQNGEVPCDVHNPGLATLFDGYLDQVEQAGIDRIFWDEAQIGCSGPQGDAPHDRTVPFLDAVSQKARARGIEFQTACIRTRDLGQNLAGEVAALPAIDEISVAPYQFHPEGTEQRTAAEVAGRVRPWFEVAQAAAQEHGKVAQAWTQGFNISPENLPTMATYVGEIHAAGIQNLALWGYRGCKIVDFLNPEGSLDPLVVWDEGSRLLNK